MFENVVEKVMVKIMERYIELVYKTSKVTVHGCKEKICGEGDEKFVVLFWHGDSYCLYPALEGSKLYIVTTKDRRGDYISDICVHFGYQTLRIPDASDGGSYLFKIGKIINGEDIFNIAISLDGPLGPYHVPKDFAIATAVLTNRRMIGVSIKIKRTITIKKRWDDFKIPLPFNEIEIDFKEPLEVTREDRKDKFVKLKEHIRTMMEEI